MVVSVMGVGLAVHVSPQTLSVTRGEEVELFVSTVFSVDDVQLFGFSDPEARRMFEELRRTSGVGAKKAMAILSILGPSQIADAVFSEDWQVLTRVPGIGPKTAKRIVLELKDRVPKVSFESQGKTSSEEINQVQEALLALGYTAQEVRKALKELGAEVGKRDIRELITKAIALLSGGKR